MSSSERVCYVQCNYCNTLLAVGVPSGVLSCMVTVRCGHCANLLSVNMAHHSSSAPPPHPQPPLQKQQQSTTAIGAANNIGSSSNDQPAARAPPIRPPEKRQRVPSAYNRFIKDEIQRIKASNPQITHREAFSAAAKNWAHFPNIHFEANKQASTAAAPNKSACGFYY